jgi:N-formylglutamate amidohydrolase
MDEGNQDVKAAKQQVLDAILSLPHTGEKLSEAIDALIEAKLVALINELSERIEAKLGVVV